MQENESEKKKVGFFGKLKNILFVEDEEETVLPDYNKQEEKEEAKEVKEVKETKEETHVVIGSRLNNDRRDIDDDVYEPRVEEVKEEKEEPVVEKEEKEEAKESPFFSFDEDEFKRLTSRVARSEAANRENEKVVTPAVNNNYNNTVKYESRTTVMSSVSSTAHPGRKPFVPSPVISPVYGILDKNYSKEDIIDKRTDRKAKTMDNLDRVRTKAFGNNKQEEEQVVEVKKEKVEIKERIVPTVDDLPKREEKPVVREEGVKPEEVVKELEEEKVDIEMPTLDAKPIDTISDVDDKISSPIEEELNNMIINDEEEEFVNEDETNGVRTGTKLDDLEKTSTLKILDDIEKELNNIKPVNNDNVEVEEDTDNDETVEKDIFDMISSMYEGGDDEDDSD